MRVQRLFTKQGQSPYEGVRFVSRASKIAKLDGTVVFEASSVVVPDTWDQVAVDILAQKYFRRAGCDFTHSGSLYNHPLAVAIRSTISIIPTGNRGEWDLRQVIHRLVGSWVTQGEAYGYFDTQEDIQAFYDEMSYMMATQMFAPNSPQWFNTGLKFAYGIEGEASGHYYVDPITDVAIKSTDSYSHPSSSACFILSIKDDLVGPGGIMDLLMREARIYKHGSGAGSNYSNIRGAGEPLSGGGVSSGLLSFLKAGDASAGAIKSGGTSRRAARMVSLDGDHPDIESFVHWKVAEEQKVAMLVAGSKLLTSTWDSMVKAYAPSEIPGIQDDPLLNPDLIKIMKRAKKDGVPMPFLDQCIKRLVQGDFRSIIPTYDLGWEGEAYGTVTSQNANNTVRFSDAFMEAVLADQDWNLLRRTDGKVHKTLKARDLWDQVVDAAWSCADPGMQFDDTINNWHTGLASGRIKSSNPCSEFLYINDSSCNLASTNLMQFQTTPNFDVEAYTHANRLITIMLEITVAMSQYPTETLARNSHDHRPLGLGYANLGTLLQDMGLPYDSSEGRSMAAAITSLMSATAYKTSVEMAKQLGPYPAYQENREHALRVLRNHVRAANNNPNDSYEKLNPRIQVTGLTPWSHSSEYSTIKSRDNYRALVSAGVEIWDEVLNGAKEYGLRNAQVSVLAPTGCLVSGSLVNSSRGLIRLGSMGDVQGAQWQDVQFDVMTDDGPRPATKFFINGLKATQRITTASGYHLQGTKLHQIKVIHPETGERVWRKLEEVAPGDIIPIQLNGLVGAPIEVLLPPIGDHHWNVGVNTITPRSMTSDLSELLGFYMGNGSLHAKGLRFCVAPQDFDVAERITHTLKLTFGIEAHTQEVGGYIEVVANSVPLAMWWDACGFSKYAPNDNHSGKGYVAHIPDALLRTNDLVMYSAFIRGLFQADGTTTQGHIAWSTVNKGFHEDVKAMLLLFGIPTSFKVDTTGWGKSALYVLRLHNQNYAARYMDRIGFMGERKRLTVKDAASNKWIRDRIYLPTHILKRIPKNECSEGFNAVSRGIALTWVTTIPEIQPFLDFFYDPVISSEDAGEQLTYDLSVPDNVTYVANGFISHNTIGLLLGCDTTGVEPDFAVVKFKKLSGGGYMKIVSHSIEDALGNLGYDDIQVAGMLDYVLGESIGPNTPGITSMDLAEAGYSADIITSWNRDLPGSFAVAYVLPIGELAAKFGTERTYAMVQAVEGHSNFEGAPYLKPEHLPIFDCANPCGKTGKRYISPDGHLLMMAAVQPFISGAISKTINLPSTATKETFSKMFMEAWKHGVKAVSLYRDGSKMSQPLATNLDLLDGLDTIEDEEAPQSAKVEVIAEALAEKVVLTGGPQPATRVKLPGRRGGYTQAVTIQGTKLYVHTGEYPDGTLGEIFLDMHKEGAAFRSIMNCFHGAEKFFNGANLVSFEDAVGEGVQVLCADGVYRPASVEAFGNQPLVEVELRPIGCKGSAYRRRIKVTPNHRWLLASGKETTTLKVGDTLASLPAQPAQLTDDWGFIHGLVFGDGWRHTYSNDRFYIRLCGAKVKHLDRIAPYARSVTYPPSCGGDPVVTFVNEGRNLKALPESVTDSYLTSFLEGWVATDGGDNGRGGTLISTVVPEHVTWLEDHAPRLGWHVTGSCFQVAGENSFKPGTVCYRVTLRRLQVRYKVTAITDRGEVAPVYCVVEPETHTFTLAGGVVTGNCFAIAISIGLQYGVPLEEFCDAFLFTKFEPQGPVQGHPAIKMATSVIDCIFRDLAVSYLGRTELAHVNPEDLINESGPRFPLSKPVSKGQTFGFAQEENTELAEEPCGADCICQEVEAEAPKPMKVISQVVAARERGYTGDPCPSCGHLTLVRNGTCLKCLTCGGTTGCS